MNKDLVPAKGYYSILQFVPDLERAEGANIGVVLFCPDKGFLKAQTATGNDRARRFFGPEENIDLDLDRLNTFKAAFEERVLAEADRIKTLEEFRHFVSTRANQLLLTEPRPIKVFDPEADLARLFDMLVGGRRRAARQAQQGAESLAQTFCDLLDQRGLADKVQRDVKIESALFQRTLVFPFAYQNGQLNVIEPASFEYTSARNIERACQLAVEGNDLQEQPQPVLLNVLGSFKPDQAENVEQVRRVLDKYGVALHTSHELDRLIEVIAQTAH
jgi:Protein of unknown function (DUF3037)